MSEQTRLTDPFGKVAEQFAGATPDDYPRRDPYPEIEPYQHEMLAVGDGHELYVEQCGNPEGLPVVFVHGGPGGGCAMASRQFFDPQRYRIVLLDQRGCGRSTPHAAETTAALEHNTTWDLVADLERVREHLGIDQWLVFGGSWGSTLALAYALKHRERVAGLILRGIFTLRASELEWYYEGGARALYPDEWERYVQVANTCDPDLEPAGPGQFIERYHHLLMNEDPAIHLPAGQAWTRWEAATSQLLPNAEHIETTSAARHAVAFARIENHFFFNKGWMDDGELIAGAREGKLGGIPTFIVQGRYDCVCPAITAWDLHRAESASHLVMINFAGHSAFQPGIRDALIAATDAWADEHYRP